MQQEVRLIHLDVALEFVPFRTQPANSSKRALLRRSSKVLLPSLLSIFIRTSTRIGIHNRRDIVQLILLFLPLLLLFLLCLRLLLISVSARKCVRGDRSSIQFARDVASATFRSSLREVNVR